MASNPPVPPADPVGDPPRGRAGSSRDEDLVRENERLKAQLRTKDLETENATLKAENERLKKAEDDREKARIAALDDHGAPEVKKKPFFDLH